MEVPETVVQFAHTSVETLSDWLLDTVQPLAAWGTCQLRSISWVPKKSRARVRERYRESERATPILNLLLPRRWTLSRINNPPTPADHEHRTSGA